MVNNKLKGWYAFMRERYIKIYQLFLSIITILSLVACGNAKTDEKKNENEYIDMSEYKGVCGYNIENSTFDYRGAVEITYDWGNGVYMPFKAMADVKSGFADDESNLSYVFFDVTEKQVDEYMKILENDGFKVGKADKSGYIQYVVHNDFMQIIFIYKEDRLTFYAYCGFANDSEIENRDIRKIIDESGLLSDNEYFKYYYVMPIEHKTVRQAGFYEYIILNENSNSAELEDDPYYMITDGKTIYLFEHRLISIWFPCSANIISSSDKTELMITTSLYNENPTYDQDDNSTGIFFYELVGNKFIKTDEKFLEPKGFPEHTYIGRKADNGFEVCLLEITESFDISKGMKSRYVIDSEAEVIKYIK